jgi:predicted metal-dependent phosphoesterase TrpH
VIDLHLHTTASDGSSPPEALVAEAVAAGIETLAVTDHDTVAAVPAVRSAAVRAGVECLAGIEITAVLDGRDVHVLGYFLDIDDAGLGAFLEAQRADRRRRVVEMSERIAALGAPIDLASLVAAGAGRGKAMGRPMVADALVRAGHAADRADAFARFIGEGAPAFIERRGASPADVIARIGEADGLAAIAHPGKQRLDDAIPRMKEAGLAAIEVFHPDHGPADVTRYLALASALDLLVTGGSDYHGPDTSRAAGLGRIGPPPAALAALKARAASRRS